MTKRLLAPILLIPLCAFTASRQTEVKVQKTSITRDQEIQLGKEAAAQVEREMEVVQNKEVEAWLNQIGQQLAKTPQANSYPYYFKLINEDSINAFALPGGPMYVHTGLIKAADSEGEVAGVLAHEMSHVALRHGAAQMSKQQTWGSILGAAVAAAGVITSQNGQCGMLCQVTQIGGGLGAQSVLMKFSRGYEKDADLNGARMMASAGYNPIDLANFFEKLQGKAGSSNQPKGLELWMSSHPAPGSRVQYVSEDITFYPKKNYANNTGNFSRVKQAVAGIPPAKLKPPQLLAAQGQPRQGVPSGYKEYAAKGFSVVYPSDWQAGQGPDGSVYLVPKGGAVQNKDSGVELILGGMINYHVPQAGAAATSLSATTTEFVQALQKGDPNMKVESTTSVGLGSQPAMLTRFTTTTSNQAEPAQQVFLYTVARQSGLWYLALAAPPSRLGDINAIFRTMTDTLTFPGDVP